MSTTRAESTVQEWGNSLAVRIPKDLARAAQLSKGRRVAMELVEGGVLVRAQGGLKLTLAQKLKQFDPALHGGEAMASSRIGAEAI